MSDAHIFQSMWFGWKRFASRLALMQSRIVLSIFYIIIIIPLSFFVSPHKNIKKSTSRWTKKESNGFSSREELSQQ